MTFFELSLVFEQAKQKGKQVNGITPSERRSLETRIDALVRCKWPHCQNCTAPTTCTPSHLFLVGYTAIAVNHIVQSKFQGAIPDLSLRKRDGVIILKRLTIVLDEAGEKGCGLVCAPCGLSLKSPLIISPSLRQTITCLIYPHTT